MSMEGKGYLFISSHASQGSSAVGRLDLPPGFQTTRESLLVPETHLGYDSLVRGPVVSRGFRGPVRTTFRPLQSSMRGAPTHPFARGKP